MGFEKIFCLKFRHKKSLSTNQESYGQNEKDILPGEERIRPVLCPQLSQLARLFLASLNPPIGEGLAGNGHHTAVTYDATDLDFPAVKDLFEIQITC